MSKNNAKCPKCDADAILVSDCTHHVKEWCGKVGIGLGVLHTTGRGICIGGRIGSIIPGIGTLLCAGVGGVAGYYLGCKTGEHCGDKINKYMGEHYYCPDCKRTFKST